MTIRNNKVFDYAQLKVFGGINVNKMLEEQLSAETMMLVDKWLKTNRRVKINC